MRDITIKDVDSIDYTNFLGNLALHRHEFCGSPGREHYKLLSFLSTLFEGQNLIDIGTHMGASASAMSFNKNNKVHTFDVMDKLLNNEGSPKSLNNVSFYLDDLMELPLVKHKDLILKSPLIFLDIDPHHGVDEFRFYNWLSDENYQGVIIFDDINHFPDMKQNLWDKISHPNKQDISCYGHWSGTGIIQFKKVFNFVDAP